MAVLAWTQAERPPVLIAETGGLIGVMTEDGRALSKPRGDGFAASVWLENDGDPAGQQAAFDRSGFLGSRNMRRYVLGGQTILQLGGRGAEERLTQACRTAALVVIAKKVDAQPAPCRFYDAARLRRTGALAVFAEGGALRLVGANERGGARLWSAR